jgi:tetratricopeptide (TPR) repeat protein
MDEAMKSLEAFRQGVDRFGTVNNRRWLTYNEAEVHYMQGRWEETLAFADAEIAKAQAGSPFYLEPNAWMIRSLIKRARGDLSGASSDIERAVELARLRKDPQVLGPTLVVRIAILLSEDCHKEAASLFAELIGFGRTLIPSFLMQSVMGEAVIIFAWSARDLDRVDEAVAVVEASPETPWAAAAMAILEGDAVAAADGLAHLRNRPPENYARLRAAEALVGQGRRDDAEAQLAMALSFFREVGATEFIRQAEELMAPPRARERG